MPVIFFVGIVFLILCIVSKAMNMVVGVLGMIGGIIITLLPNLMDLEDKLAFYLEYGIDMDELRTYGIIVLIVGVALLVVGILRGRGKSRGQTLTHL